MRFSRVLVLAILFALSLVVVGCGADQEASDTTEAVSTNPVPDTLADLSLSGMVEGPEALVQVERLHGKGLGKGLDEAWIGRYGTQGEITLWISRSYEETDAVELLERMALSIDRSETPFTAVGTSERSGTTVYELDGMGQKHYYFRLGSDLYWVAAPPQIGEQTLDELLEVDS